jgi:hypothetical protein
MTTDGVLVTTPSGNRGGQGSVCNLGNAWRNSNSPLPPPSSSAASSAGPPPSPGPGPPPPGPGPSSQLDVAGGGLPSVPVGFSADQMKWFQTMFQTAFSRMDQMSKDISEIKASYLN